MKAIWSLWTKPLINNHNTGLWSFYHYFYSWIISVLSISRFYKSTELYTDELGKILLIDILKIPFKKIIIAFEEISNLNIEWWAIGKIKTYSLQKESFIHFDNDVFLWDALPERINKSVICAQSPEFFDENDADVYYRINELEQFIKNNNGWLPDFWYNYTKNKTTFEAACCGIFGGNNIKLIRDYSNKALDIVLCKENINIWNKWENLILGNVLIEQFFLILYLDYSNLKISKKHTIEYLFDKHTNPFDSNNKNKYYTHLISNSKNINAIKRILERFILINYPEYISRTFSAVQFIEKEITNEHNK